MRNILGLTVVAVAVLGAWALAGDDKKPGAGHEGHGGAAAGPAAEAGGDPWATHRGNVPFILGFEKGMAAVKDTGKPPMLFITTTWCGYCKKLAGESFTDDAVVKILAKFTPVIVDGDVEKDICTKYKANGFPKVVFCDVKGEAVSAVDGYVPKAEFQAKAEDAAKSIKSGKPSKEYQALVDAKADLDKALGSAKSNVKAALQAITKIEKLGRPGEIADAAKVAKDKLLAAGQAKLDEARKSFEAGEKDAARKAATSLASEYAGTDLADAAKKLVAEIGPAAPPAK
ncbi:MAG: thioredoxin fold domain-containing protein [Planctomycetes bacterium]|nr:thioredoxin fold domain-containing protein [Planctomycetota bacterium]